MAISENRIKRFSRMTKILVEDHNNGIDQQGCVRDFYLHLHENKTYSGNCSVNAQKLTSGKTRTKEHFYRPQAWFKLFCERPDIVDDIKEFSRIYMELSKVALTTAAENTQLKKFAQVRTSVLYEVAGVELVKKEGSRYANSTKLEHAFIEVPKFMEDYEIQYLDRV